MEFAVLVVLPKCYLISSNSECNH